MSESTIASLASEAYGYFTTQERGDETITVLEDGRPEWVLDLVFAAHGTDADGTPSMLPDDWKYEAVAAALEAISDAGEDAELGDVEHEFADGHVSVYTHERFAWLSSNLTRQGYVDEAREEGLIGEDADINEQIGVGMYAEAREVFGLVCDSLRERVDEEVAA